MYHVNAERLEAENFYLNPFKKNDLAQRACECSSAIVHGGERNDVLDPM